MSYKVVNPATAPLAPGEGQITLDTGETVAVKIVTTRLGDGGSVSIRAAARQIDAKSGNTELDANGAPIASSFSHTADVATVKKWKIYGLSKDALLLLLGEPTLIFGQTPGLPLLDQAVADSASIRTDIATAAALTVGADVPSLLA